MVGGSGRGKQGKHAIIPELAAMPSRRTKVQVPEDALRNEHRRAEEKAGVTELLERQEVHPLILCLLEQRGDPSGKEARHG